MKKELKNNSGYTLVELILVIAIILIMSGGAMLTVSAIRSSQATSSMQKFDDEIAALEMKTKSFSVGQAIKIVQNYGTCTDNDVSTFTADSAEADSILERVSIYYSDSYDADAVSTPLTSAVILVRKSDGEILSGYGEYKFCKYNTTSSVGRVTLNRYTGGHTYGKN